MPFHSDIQPHLYSAKDVLTGVGIAGALIAFLMGRYATRRRPAAR